MTSTLIQQIRENEWRNRVHGKIDTSNVKQMGLKRKQYTNLISTESISDDSSDESFRGRCFLKSNSREMKKSSSAGKEPMISSDEDEKTEDLLVAFEASTSKKVISKSPKSKYPTNSVSSEVKARSSHADRSQASVSSTVQTKSSARVSPFDNMLVLRDDGEGGFEELSVVSFINDESIKDAATTEAFKEPSQTMSVFSNTQVLLSVDELDEETQTNSKRISHRTEQRRKRRDNNEDRPSTVSEVEESFGSKSLPAPTHTQTTVQGATSPYDSDVQSISEEETNSISLRVSQSKNKSLKFITPEQDDPDQYSDDFDSEPEIQPSELASENSSINGELFERSKHINQKDINTRSSEKFQTPCVASNSSSRQKISQKYPEAKLSYSVEVQTMWTGDWIPSLNGQISSSGLTGDPPTTCRLDDTRYSVQPKSIIKTVVDDKALQTLTEHNPCVVALDNMLQQQVKITRDFLSTQRQLHNAISTALNRCLTTDYITWENTAKLLQSGDSP